MLRTTRRTTLARAILEPRPIRPRQSSQLHEILKRSVGSVELKSDVNSEVNDKVDYDHDAEEEK